MKSFYISIAVAILAVTLRAAPSPSDVEQSLRQQIESASGRQIKLATFTKTDGQSLTASGIPHYRMDFTAEIEFQANGVWYAGPGLLAGTEFRFAIGQPNRGSLAGFESGIEGGIPVQRGGRAKLAGIMDGQQKESGWKFQISECNIVSQSPPGTPPADTRPRAEIPERKNTPPSPEATQKISAVRNSIGSMLAKSISSESERHIRLNKATIHMTQIGEAEKYAVSYQADVEFKTNGVWLSNGTIATPVAFHFTETAHSWDPPPRFKVHRGDHALVSGSLTAEKRDTGWKLLMGDNHFVWFKTAEQVAAMKNAGGH